MKYRKQGSAGRIVAKIARVLGKIVSFGLPAILILLIGTGAAGVRYLCVLSPSMEPELPVGSLIVVLPQKPENVKEGDNLTYMIGGNFVTHKVLRNDMENGFIYTKGIAGKLEDAPVPYTAVKGIQKICIPGLGVFAEKLGTAKGKIIVLSTAAVIFLTVITVDIVTGRRRRKAANQFDLTACAADKNTLY